MVVAVQCRTSRPRASRVASHPQQRHALGAGLHNQWHLRHQADPMHQGLGQQLKAVMPEALPAGNDGA